MVIEIFPYQGIDNARLGMNRTEIRSVLGGAFRPYIKGASDADQFLGNATHAYYGPQGLCEAFEIYAPSRVRLFDMEIVGVPYNRALRYLQSLDEGTQARSTGARSLQLGISLYAPYAEDAPDAPVEAVLVFARGYWD